MGPSMIYLNSRFFCGVNRICPFLKLLAESGHVASAKFYKINEHIVYSSGQSAGQPVSEGTVHTFVEHHKSSPLDVIVIS